MEEEQGRKDKKEWNGTVYLTADDLAQMLKVSRVLVYKLVREQKIPFYHIEKCVRFAPEEIQGWLEIRRNRELHMPRKLKRPHDAQSSDKN